MFFRLLPKMKRETMRIGMPRQGPATVLGSILFLLRDNKAPHLVFRPSAVLIR